MNTDPFRPILETTREIGRGDIRQIADVALRLMDERDAARDEAALIENRARAAEIMQEMLIGQRDAARGALVEMARWIEAWWPADIFTGVSGDEGALKIVALRGLLEGTLGADAYAAALEASE